MSDGTRLAYDLFLPTKKGVPANEPLPVLFKYTPYDRAWTVIDKDGNNNLIGLGMPWYYDPMVRFRAWVAPKGNGKIMDALFRTKWLKEMVNSGYAVIVVDRPGTGASFGDLAADDAWLLRRNDELAAFAVGSIAGPILTVSNMLLTEAASPVEAVAAIARELPGRFAYLRVEVSCPVEAVSLEKAGFPTARPDWHVFMIKPLAGATVDDARRLFGIGTPHFQMSWLDVT